MSDAEFARELGYGDHARKLEAAAGYIRGIEKGLRLVAARRDALEEVVRYYADKRMISRAAYPDSCVEDRKLRDLVEGALPEFREVDLSGPDGVADGAPYWADGDRE